MRPRRLLVWLALAIWLFALSAPRPPRAAASTGPAELSLAPPPEQRSVSRGFPWHGHLERGMHLDEDHVIRHLDEYREHDRFWGTWQLVQLVRRAATRVAERFPGSRLSIGELSGPRGGRIVGHNSHRNGRDIDIGFYMIDDDTGAQATPPTFVPIFRKSGLVYYAGGRYHFDDARNWTLLSKLIDDDDARVQYVFVLGSLQRRLLAYAEKIGAPAALITRARAVLLEPTEGNRHQSHFHVRIYCPAEDRPGCYDKPPYFPWYPGTVPPGAQLAKISRGIEL